MHSCTAATASPSKPALWSSVSLHAWPVVYESSLLGSQVQRAILLIALVVFPELS